MDFLVKSNYDPSMVTFLIIEWKNVIENAVSIQNYFRAVHTWVNRLS